MAELSGERLSCPRTHRSALGARLGNNWFNIRPRDLTGSVVTGCENLRLPRDQLNGHFSTEAELRLHLTESCRNQPGAVEVHRKPGLRVRAFRPTCLQR